MMLIIDVEFLGSGKYTIVSIPCLTKCRLSSSCNREKSPFFLSNLSIGPVTRSMYRLSVKVRNWRLLRGSVLAESSNLDQSCVGFPPVQTTYSSRRDCTSPPMMGLSGMKTSVFSCGSSFAAMIRCCRLLDLDTPINGLVRSVSDVAVRVGSVSGGTICNGRVVSCWDSRWASGSAVGSLFGASRGSTVSCWGSELELVSLSEFNQSKLPSPLEVGEMSSAVVDSWLGP